MIAEQTTDVLYWNKCVSFKLRAFQFEWHQKWVNYLAQGIRFYRCTSAIWFSIIRSHGSLKKTIKQKLKTKTYLLFFCSISFLFLILFLLLADHFFSSFLCAPSSRTFLWNWTEVHSLWSFAPRVSSDRQTWFIVAVRTMRPHSRVMLLTDSFQ